MRLRSFVLLSIVLTLSACATAPRYTGKDPAAAKSLYGRYEKPKCASRIQKLCEVAYIVLQNKWPLVSEDEMAAALKKSMHRIQPLKEVLSASLPVQGAECPARIQAFCATALTALNRAHSEKQEKEVTEALIKGLFENLDMDRYSYYVPRPGNLPWRGAHAPIPRIPDDKKKWTKPYGDEGGRAYTGVGITMNDEHTRIFNVFSGTPAERAGLKRGDHISILKETGSLLVLSVTDPCGMKKPRTVMIGKTSIVHDNVTAKLVAPGIGYIGIDIFGMSAGTKMKRVLQKLAQTNGAPLAGLILDLEGNPGGTIGSMTLVASWLLPRGTLVMTSQPGGIRHHTDTEGYDMLAGAPIVVLVNEDSASASEALSAALQDHGRATIVGVVSHGKGTIQTTKTLRDGSKIHITRGFVHTPSGRGTNKVGVTPDISVTECGSAAHFKKGLSTLKELIATRARVARATTTTTTHAPF